MMPPMRCECTPKMVCLACRTYKHGHPAFSKTALVASPETACREHAPTLQTAITEERIRAVLSAWIGAQGRLPLSVDFRGPQGWHIDAQGYALTHSMLYRYFGGIEALWEYCLAEGLCEPHHVREVKARRSRSLATNGKKGRQAQRTARRAPGGP